MTIRTVNGVTIGDVFEFEGDVFEITGFKSRNTVFGKNIDCKPGSPSSCKVSLREVTIKNKEV